MNTFSTYLKVQQQENAIDNGLVQTVEHIVKACVNINQRVRLGSLGDILGEAGSSNIQGEAQKKLDVIANQLLIEELKQCNAIAGLASEEEDSFVACHEKDGQYLVLFDPLDGSSNIDVNISIGTIFSVLEKPQGELMVESFLQKGKQQVAAGYVLYGPQTLLVLTFKNGVSVFTLNEQGEFIQTLTQCSVPVQTAEFAINMSNQRYWQAPMQQYIAELLAGKEGKRGKNYNMRWVASMVAEVHRILMRGGVFMYPKDARDPSKPGKLRLMYEANPLSLILEQAGGYSTDLQHEMLEIQPSSLHQRVAVVLGSKEEVTYVWQLHQ